MSAPSEFLPLICKDESSAVSHLPTYNCVSGGGATEVLSRCSIRKVTGELRVAVPHACTQSSEMDQLRLKTTPAPPHCSDPTHICFPDSHQRLHLCLPRQTKAIRVSLVWFGSRPPKTNTCKPYNMVICSGWGKERGFINNGANRVHIKPKFGLLEGDEGYTEGLGETEVIQ